MVDIFRIDKGSSTNKILQSHQIRLISWSDFKIIYLRYSLRYFFSLSRI